ncbi:MAG: glycosyl hydrolase family 28-related protein [Sedimentisphaerales bacterium]|nr:glycosyl hydrolase family 28-related protein [Sedimentisphaerales bacterium]
MTHRNSIHWPLGSISKVIRPMLVMAGLIATAQTAIAAGSGVFNIRDYGAAGDGRTLDMMAINKAIEACAAAGGGQVLLPPGKYLSGTVHLKSHISLFLEAGATLVGTTELDKYQKPTIPSFMPEAKWGKWHRALILGDGLEDISISGHGVIDGNKVFDPTGEERMRGPHTFVFVNCRNVKVSDISFLDSANYAIFFQISDDVDIHNVKFTGGWDGIHFRGAPQRPCRNVSIVGCQFFTGDDSIAGRYWENTLISDCIINSSCNGIRLIGPAEHLIIHDCLFYGPGIRPHRSSNRNNMLAGLNLQPGAWDATKGSLDNVLISDITMHNVSTPFHFSLKPGNTAGNIIVNRVSATGVYRAASSVESWAETAFKNAVFRDVTIEYIGGGTKKQALTDVKSPGVDARPLPAWGFYARNIKNLQFDNVRLRYEKEDLRPVLKCEDVELLTLEDFKFPLPAQSQESEAFSLDDVMYVRLRGMNFTTVEPRCIELKLTTDDTEDRYKAGKFFSAIVTIENGKQKGLAKIELVAAEQKKTRWIWLQAGQKKEVLFKGLSVSNAGTHEVRCGNIVQRLLVVQ